MNQINITNKRTRQSKRGQITVFLIIGIIILALFAGVYYVVSDYQTTELSAEKKAPLSLTLKSSVDSFVSSCVKQVAVPGFYLLGVQGGLIYADDPTKVLITENALINYGYLEGINQFSTTKIDQDLTIYLNDSLNTCLQNFSFFESQGTNITIVGEMKVYSTISKNDVMVTLKYPLMIESGQGSMKIEDFSTKIPIRLGTIIDQANKIIENHKKNPAFIDLNYLTTFDTFVSVFPFDEDIVIYSISDDKSVINKAPFAFMFAIKDSKVNTAPELDYISDKVLKKGLEFTMQLTAEDEDAIIFSSDSKLFPVNNEGWLNVTINQVGTYQVNFKVTDTKKQTDSQKVGFVVEK